MNDLKIWKIVFEVRYPAAALLFDNRGAIASKWQWTSDLTEWRISNNLVTLHNKSNTTVLNTGFKQTSVVMELPESSALFCNRASEFSSWVLDTLRIKNIERVGLRFIQVAKRQHFKLLVSKMRENLFNMREDEWALLGGPPEDIAVPLTLALGENKANVTLGPMKAEQLTDFFESAEVKSKIPEVALFFDFDLYRSNPDFSSDSYEEKIGSFLKTGSQQIIEISSQFVEKYGGFK